MNFGKMALILVCALILIPIAGTVLLQFGSAMFVYNVAAKVSDEAGVEPIERPNWKINDSDGVKPEVHALARPTQLHSYRRVIVQQVMSLAEMPGGNPGKISPDEETSHALARVPVIAQEECKLIASVFADKCEVHRTFVKRREDGLYNVDMTLRYTQKQAFGNVNPNVPVSFVEMRENLDPSKRGRDVPRAGQLAARRAFYQEAVAACSRLKARTGNCGLLGIEIRTGGGAPGSPLNLSGGATLGTLQAHARS